MRRLIAIGAAIGAGLAAVSAMLVVSPASADHPSSAVQPTVVAGNPTCGDFKPDTFEFKIEPVESGTYPFAFDDVSGTVTLDVDAPLFDFSIDGAVALAVVVKGGPNANLYDYQPDGVTSDVDLHAPINPRTGEPFGLSHVSFCLAPAPATGALLIEKLSSKTEDFVTNEGATFSFTNGSSGTVTDNGAGDEHPDIGLICVSDLEPGEYTVTETAAPEGYAIVDDTATANVVADTDCDENLPAAADRAVFENAPLFDIQTNFRDGGSGETSLVSIECNGFDHLDDPATEGWDDSQTNEGIAFTSDDTTMTITCEIVVDP